MYTKKPNEELSTEELLLRLLNYHNNVVLDNYHMNNTYESTENGRMYEECLQEMFKRIKKEKIK